MTALSRSNGDDEAVCEEHEVPTTSTCRPDSWWSWLVCCSSAMSVIIVVGITYCFGLLLSPLMEYFDETRQATAWVGSLYTACGCLFSPISSHISERFSFRFTAILGSLAGITGFILASMSSKLWMMYLTVGVLSGFGHVMIFNSCSLIVLQYFVKWRSVATGIVASAPAIGMFVMTQITQSLLNRFGWRGPLIGFALLHVVCGFCSAVFVPLENMKEKHNNANTDGKARYQETTRKNACLWRNHSFLILLSSLIVVIFAYWVPAVHIVKHCEQELHIPGNKASMIFTYMAITSFISRNVFCKLGDLRYFKRLHLYQGGVTIYGLCVLCLPLARSFTSVLAIFIVAGLMEGAMLGQLSLLVLECCGKHKVNQGWGYIFFFTGVSFAIGSPMAGLMADKLGSYNATFYTAGAILIAGASIISLMKCVKQQPEKAEETQCYVVELVVTEKLTVV